MSGQDWDKYVRARQEAMMTVCIETAKSHGYPCEAAMMCEAGELGCPDCPFVEEEE